MNGVLKSEYIEMICLTEVPVLLFTSLCLFYKRRRKPRHVP